jgi:dienelactone hydrolase
MLASSDAHQVHVTALDYMRQRREIVPERIAVVGASFGGYWATKLAHVEPKRLRAVVNWGGGIHSFFQPEWQERSRNADSIRQDNHGGVESRDARAFFVNSRLVGSTQCSHAIG